jgi:sugar O-acyltransferase (sialic acid O-acetyltransferase NeuD family)
MNTTKSLIFIGSTGGCADLIVLNEAMILDGGQYKSFASLDDNPIFWAKTVYGIPVLGGTKSIASYKLDDRFSFITAIGNSSNYKLREGIISSFNVDLSQWAQLLHPSTSISEFSQIGRGTSIHANVSIGPNVNIGNHCVILPNSYIGHDTIIEDYSIINAGCVISGNCQIGKNCYIGSGSIISDHLTVGRGCLIGTGSLVLKNCIDNSIYYGSPARYVKSN